MDFLLRSTMYTIIYFSPTGNVLHLARLLAAELKSPERDILPLEFTDPKQLESNKHLVLLYPVHGFNAPRTVKRFVRSLPPGLYEWVSLIGVGCLNNWLDGAVSSDLLKSFRKKAYPIVVDEILAMPLTFIMKSPDDLKNDQYAIRYFHDENKNEELDTNFLGIPKEGFVLGNEFNHQTYGDESG